MRVEVLVPQIGEAVAELLLIAWHKHIGDPVKKGDLLFEIDSDKAIVEVDAFVDGTLTEIIEPKDSAVMPQQVVAIIETAAVDRAVESGGGQTISESPSRLDLVNKSPAIENSSATVDQDVKRADVQRRRPRPKISPKARRLAKHASLDWTSIAGSGADGMILVSDVERAIEAKGGRSL